MTQLKKGIRPGSEKRYKLLTVLREMDIPMSTIAQLVEPMRGKNEPEKEAIAAKILEELKTKE